MIHKVAPPGRGVEESMAEHRRRARAEQRIGLHNLSPAPGSRRPRKRVGRGEGSGTGKTAGPRAEGLGLALGRQAARPVRGRPEPDSHADAQAARPAHEEVDAVRAVPHPHAAGQPASTSRRASRPAMRSRSRRCSAKGLATRKDIPVKILAKGELDQAADRARARRSAAPPASRSRPPAAPARCVED